MKRTLTCIVCPVGCQLEVELEDKKVVSVSGNTCKRGAEYAVTECTNPRRVITTTVRTAEGFMLPVKTHVAIPKEMIFECMKCINSLKPQSNHGYKIGDVLCENILGTGADVVSCADVQGK